VTGVRRLSAADFDNHVPGLADLFVDAVASGASLGFPAPFEHEAAARWWREQESAVVAGERVVFVSCGAGRVDGTVSLSFERMPNARHRGNVGKLMVHRDARGRGLGRTLLATAEQAAAAAGVTLLLLDTESGSAAEHLYRSAGWTCYGEVPGYAADTTGTALRRCSFYYKPL
jgi:ribosomal protein S18 acetylase RimI-like enzyme